MEELLNGRKKKLVRELCEEEKLKLKILKFEFEFQNEHKRVEVIIARTQKREAEERRSGLGSRINIKL